MNRTHYCGALRESEIGREVTVCGWVLTKRDMGGVVFIDLRDREGVLQTVFDASALTPDEFRVADGLKNQSVIEVTGLIRKRGEETYNPKLATGTIELAANKIKLPVVCRDPAVRARRLGRRARGSAAQISLPRPAPPRDVQKPQIPSRAGSRDALIP